MSYQYKPFSKHPSVHSVNSIRSWDVDTEIIVPVDVPGSPQGFRHKYVPARSLGFPSFFSRVRIAWNVFTGRYDALVWEQQ